LEGASNQVLFECSCCQDLDPLAPKKDMKYVQNMFGHCAARDIYDQFRRMAEKKLAGEVEAQKQWWERQVIEELVDLMRGVTQPQDLNNLRVLNQERKIHGNKEPQPDMTNFKLLKA